MQKAKLQFSPMAKFQLADKIKNLCLCAVIFTFCFSFFNVSEVNAAELFFEAENREFTQGDDFLVNIFLNTEVESINAAEGKILFTPRLLEIREIRDGNSIVNFWIERPIMEQPGVIVFSGITPGGYQGEKEFLFSVVFRAKTTGRGAIEIREARVLKNDGEGTPVGVKISPFQFSISQEGQAVQPMVEPVKDIHPPGKFKPEIAQSQEIFNGEYSLVFTAQDKESGIDHYEVREGLFDEFHIAKSPYLVQDQSLDKKIYIKAVDKSGNESTEILYPPYWHPWYKNYWILGILIISAIFITYIIRRKF